MRCALYARISRDPEDQSAGVDRQLVRGREVAQVNGWTVAATFVDNDASGYHGDRPGFDQLQEAIRAGEIEAVIVQHQDRLARNVTAFRTFADLCVEHDVRIETWAGPVDTSSAAGKFQSTIQAATDEHYSALISEKARAAHAEIAARGEPNGGRRPFGYIRTRNAEGFRTFEPHPDEAASVREAFERFCSGESLGAISKGFDAAGLTTAGGGKWNRGRVRDMLNNPIYAGFRVHRGEIVGKGNWPPLVDVETSETARAILAGRRRGPAHNVRRNYLAGGVARCGVCGGPLKAKPLRGKKSYACPPTTEGGCGKIRILGDDFEQHIADVIVTALTDPRIAEALQRRQDAGNGEALAELDALERRRTDAAEAFAMGEIDRSQLAAITAKLDERRDEIITKLKPANGPRLTIHDLADLWESEDVQWRNRVASTLFEKIVVHPAVQGRNFYDPDRVEIVWRT